MTTYYAKDLIGKTLYVTGKVPMYKTTTYSGQTRPSPVAFLNSGDYFTVDSYINKLSSYSTGYNRDDNYYLGDNGYVVSFSDLTGKYDLKALEGQGVKTVDQKVKEEREKGQSKFFDFVKKFGIFILAVPIAIAAIKYRKK
jgi:hypothetical protein